MESPPPPKLTVFIYALTEPTGEIRYIGKSVAPTQRFSAHLRDKVASRKTRWINSLRSKGLLPLWKVLDEVPVDYWQQWEAAYIQFFLEEGCDLVNETKGGEGAESGKVRTPEHCRNLSIALTGKIRSEESKRNQSIAITGRKLSVETREHMAEARRGEKNHFFGKHHTEEANEKNRVAHLGRKNTEEHKQALRIGWEKWRANKV